MSTNFPTGLDSFPTAADLADDTLATKPHSTTHGNLGDAVLAVETKVGVDNSGVTTTLDYRVRAIENGRGAANGYASLDANTRVPTAQIASGTPTINYAPIYNGTNVVWSPVSTTSASTNYSEAVRFYEFPQGISGEAAYNSVLHSGPQLWTGLDGSTYKQWAIFVNSSSQAIACQRSLPLGNWTAANLMTVTDTPFTATTGADEHNSYAIAVDTAGRCHVIGNVNNSNMDDDASHDTFYATSGTSWSTTFSKAVMSGTSTELDSVDYPWFFAQSDGTLYWLQRDGTSGGPADVILRKWGGSSWSKVGSTILSSATWSAYMWVPAVDRWPGATNLDRIHLFWCWRDTTSADTNEDFYHAYSDDDGVTWKSLATGSTITTPIAKTETAGRIFDSGQPPVGDAGSWNMQNQGGACVDINGYPHALVYMGKSGARSTQVLWHVYWDGAAWQTYQLGDFTNGAGRCPIFALSDGSVWGLYQNDWAEHRGTVRLIDLNPSSSTYGTLTFPIAGPHLDLFTWYPSYDVEALWLLNELHIPITPQVSSSTHASYIAATNWNNQWGGVLTIDLDQLPQFAKGEVELPGIEIIGTVSKIGPDIVVSQSAEGEVGIGSFALTGAYQAQSQLFARLRGKGWRLGSNSMSVTIRETATTGTTSSRGRIDFNSTSTLSAETPWVPLRTISGSTQGFIEPYVYVGASTIGDLVELTMDIGRWTLPREWS